MNELRIISIGKELDHPFVDTVGYRSSFSLLDYDIAIWDPNDLLSEYEQHDFGGYIAISSEDIFHIREDISRRKKEMLEFLDLGRTIFIFTPKPQKYFSGKDLSDITNSLPANDIRTIAASGGEIEFRSKNRFKSLWDINNEFLTYRAYFEKNIGESLFFIKNTDKVIGTYLHFGKGHLIFIPNFLDPEFEFYLNPEGDQILSKKFVDSVIEIVRDINKDNNDLKLPKWSSSYSLPDEREGLNSLDNLNAELDLLETRKESQYNFLPTYRSIKYCSQAMEELWN